MIHGLLRRKICTVGGQDAFNSEDVLTSVVLGAASYEPERALLPFLREARSGANEAIPLPVGSVRAACEFWPSVARALDGSEAGIDGGEPELIVRLDGPDQRRSILLVEVKLGSGISSPATPAGPVSHQLAKYWLHLLRLAKEEDREPIGVVFITQGISFPFTDIEAAAAELRDKRCPAGSFYWVSWRRFERVINADGAPMLQDVLKLLRERWELTWIDETWKWPSAEAIQPPPLFFRKDGS